MRGPPGGVITQPSNPDSETSGNNTIVGPKGKNDFVDFFQIFYKQELSLVTLLFFGYLSTLTSNRQLI